MKADGDSWAPPQIWVKHQVWGYMSGKGVDCESLGSQNHGENLLMELG